MYKFYIINKFDRPCEKLLAVEKNGKLHYCHPHLANEYKNVSFDIDEESTPVEDFGLSIEVNSLGLVIGKKIAKSKAIYRDKQVREWQGEPFFTFEGIFW